MIIQNINIIGKVEEQNNKLYFIGTDFNGNKVFIEILDKYNKNISIKKFKNIILNLNNNTNETILHKIINGFQGVTLKTIFGAYPNFRFNIQSYYNNNIFDNIQILDDYILIDVDFKKKTIINSKLKYSFYNIGDTNTNEINTSISLNKYNNYNNIEKIFNVFKENIKINKFKHHPFKIGISDNFILNDIGEIPFILNDLKDKGVDFIFNDKYIDLNTLSHNNQKKLLKDMINKIGGYESFLNKFYIKANYNVIYKAILIDKYKLLKSNILSAYEKKDYELYLNSIDELMKSILQDGFSNTPININFNIIYYKEDISKALRYIEDSLTNQIKTIHNIFKKDIFFGTFENGNFKIDEKLKSNIQIHNILGYLYINEKDNIYKLKSSYKNNDFINYKTSKFGVSNTNILVDLQKLKNIKTNDSRNRIKIMVK